MHGLYMTPDEIDTLQQDAYAEGRKDEREDQCGRAFPHDWREDTDWMGDPDVPNGMVSWTVWRCATCGDESLERPSELQREGDGSNG